MNSIFDLFMESWILPILQGLHLHCKRPLVFMIPLTFKIWIHFLIHRSYRYYFCLHDPWVCTFITLWVFPYLCPSVHPSVNPFMKMVIRLEPHGTFLSYFAYICISTFPLSCKPIYFDRCGFAEQLSSHTRMQNGCDGSPNIILACPGILVKMLVTLELHGVF